MSTLLTASVLPVKSSCSVAVIALGKATTTVGMGGGVTAAGLLQPHSPDAASVPPSNVLPNRKAYFPRNGYRIITVPHRMTKRRKDRTTNPSKRYVSKHWTDMLTESGGLRPAMKSA